MMYAVEMASYGIIPILMNIVTGFRAILRSWFSNFKGCNVGIT
jgi:hypothetical protein